MTNTGTIDIIGASLFDLLPGNGNYVDLDGSGGGPGLLSSKTTFTLLPGVTYTLQFDLAGSQRGDVNTVAVGLGAAFSESFTRNSGDPFTTVTRTITVAAPTVANLTFLNNGPGDNVGALLDRVSLSDAAAPGGPAAVSEPLSLLLVGGGLAGMGVLRRRNCA